MPHRLRSVSSPDEAPVLSQRARPDARLPLPACTLALVILASPVIGSEHPRLLFSQDFLASLRTRAAHPILKPVAERVLARAETALVAPPLVPSLTKRGAPDPPGEMKGLAAARALQGRVLSLAMAFTLTGERRFRDGAVRELDRALADWRIWVDTAHQPPYDLMTGENALTFGLAYDWLYADLTPVERQRLQEGAERRALRAYLDAVDVEKPRFFFAASNNWNPVCNGGASVLALALEGESQLAERVLSLAVPAMRRYWDHLKEDGGWDEGTGYWTYGHRYGFIAAEALRRAGRPGGAEVFALAGARRTGYFPLVFNPGRSLTAGFGDSNRRAHDAIFYLLGREYRNPDFIWFQDRQPGHGEGERWPEEALTLLWRPLGEPWLPEAQAGFTPQIEPVAVFPSIGWALLAPSQPDPPFFLSLKNGSLAASHTHLDLNHVSVGVGETLLAVELGSRPYPADYFGPARRSYYEITTAGHNSVLVGGRGQAPRGAGTLRGPLSGAGYTALVGVADGAYEVETTRARRHVVFVDRRYFVLLDEIETPRPESIDLRFHTYAEVRGSRHSWTIEQDGAALDILADPALEVAVEEAPGWIRPVRVIRLRSPKPQTALAVVTVLYPRAGHASAPGMLSTKRRGQVLEVAIGADRLRFVRGRDGWAIGSVRAAAPATP